VLMKIVAIALCCQFTVSVERPRFTVSVADDSATLHSERDPPVEYQPAPKQYLAMFTSASCGPCQQWKRNVLPQLQSAGYHVRLISMDDPANREKYRNRITRYPSFAVIDWHTGSWLSGVTVGSISKAAAVRMLDGPRLKQRSKAEPVQTRLLAPPQRFIQWPGWGRIDLETYGGTCTCSMCVQIKAMQRDYWRQLRAWQQTQATVSPDQEGTPHAVVEDLLDQMQLRAGDVLADLGCGDARILISAARRGVRGIGVELDPERAEVARRNVAAAGVGHLVLIETGDALEFDMSRVTAATAYLYPPLLAKLAGRLKGLRKVATPYHHVPGLPMFRVGDTWFYESGTHDEQVMANNTVRDLRGHYAAAGAGSNAAGR
jgi:hypothetical protein